MMQACRKRIAWILGQDMCAIRTARNAVLENSTECPPRKIQDCVMDQWKPSECSVTCDDSCVASSPDQCGGWMQISRQSVAEGDSCGIQCPAKTRETRCGQIKCPIDCVMSM